MPELTPFQTLGPFFAFALPYTGGETLADDSTPGTRIMVEGRVRDGAGDAVPDALIEVWQADAQGRYRHPHDPDGTPADQPFTGFGRIPTDADGRFAFTTIKPGAVRVPGGSALQAPHIVVGLLARGLLTRLVTRIYFDDEPATDADPILALVPAGRRATLIARREGDDRYQIDFVLQGQNETVFFDV
jgi:protocatechuate 3,4-dioxygenase alpha subunit